MNKADISGCFGFLGLGELLQLIGSNGGTGVLQITSDYAQEPGIIYFHKGNIINGKALSQTGLDAVYALFGWTDGEFEFTEQDVKAEKVINANRMEIILDGLRMIDEGAVKKLGPVSFEQKESGASAKAASNIPVIRGPLVDYMYVVAEEEFSEGFTIIKENSHGSWIWAILEGDVDIVKETPSGPLSILRLGNGSFIGSIGSFSYQSNIRNATVVAVNNVQLGVLDSQRLTQEFGYLSSEFKSFLISLENRRMQLTDMAVDIYLGKNEYKKFVKDKKPVMKQGKKEANLYLIKDGQAAIIRKEKSGYVPLAKLGKNDFIGRIPFLDIGHEPHYASVFATPDFDVVRLNQDKIQEEYDQLSPLFRNLIENIGTCISLTTRAACEFQRKAKEEKTGKNA